MNHQKKSTKKNATNKHKPQRTSNLSQGTKQRIVSYQEHLITKINDGQKHLTLKLKMFQDANRKENAINFQNAHSTYRLKTTYEIEQQPVKKKLKNNKTISRVKTLGNELKNQKPNNKSKQKVKKTKKCRKNESNTFRTSKSIENKSTKLATQRNKESIYQFKMSKNQKSTDRKIEKKKSISKKYQNKIQCEEIQPLDDVQTMRKRDLRIKTQFSDSKEEFGTYSHYQNHCIESNEEHMHEKFNENQFLQKKIVSPFNDGCQLEKATRSIQTQSLQFLQSIKGSKNHAKFQQKKDLSYFKKIQTLRWKVMVLELNLLKSNPKYIDKIINQSETNRKDIIQEAQQMLNHNSFLNKYVFQRPDIVQSALSSSKHSLHDSIQQQQKIVKNLSDKKLLKELQMIEPESYFNTTGNEKNYSQQFEKELQQYSSGDFGANKNKESHLQYFQIDSEIVQSRKNIVNQVQDALLKEFCLQLVNHKKLLHNFLNASLKQAEQNEEKPVQIQKFPQYFIDCDQNYTLQVMTRLFDYIQTHQDVLTDFMIRLSQPFNQNKLLALKQLRQYYLMGDQEEEQNQQEKTKNSEYEEQQSQDQSEQNIDVLTHDFLNLFETSEKQQIGLDQYLYNHCIYKCINEILNTIRPYGIAGEPLFVLFGMKQKLKLSFFEVVTKIVKNFIKIIRVRMGQTVFLQAGSQVPLSPEQTLCNVKRSFEAMDQLLILQQDQRWQNMEHYFIQNKYLLANEMVNEIINEQILMIFTDFMAF